MAPLSESWRGMREGSSLCLTAREESSGSMTWGGGPASTGIATRPRPQPLPVPGASCDPPPSPGSARRTKGREVRWLQVRWSGRNRGRTPRRSATRSAERGSFARGRARRGDAGAVAHGGRGSAGSERSRERALAEVPGSWESSSRALGSKSADERRVAGRGFAPTGRVPPSLAPPRHRLPPTTTRPSIHHVRQQGQALDFGPGGV